MDQTIEKVSFCAPDRNLDKAFSYICRDGTTRRWICHCFLALKDSVSIARAQSLLTPLHSLAFQPLPGPAIHLSSPGLVSSRKWAVLQAPNLEDIVDLSRLIPGFRIMTGTRETLRKTLVTILLIISSSSCFSSLHIFSNREEGMSSLFGSCMSFLITFHWSEPSHMDFLTCKRQWEIEPLFCFVTWTLTSVPHPQSQPPTLASSLVAGNRNQSG